MRINKVTGSIVRTAAVFTAAVLFVISVAFFAVPGRTVSADVGQPDIPVPALSDVHCASYCVYDKTTGYIVISMNPDDRIYPASMTKIMTCMLSLEYLDTSARLEVSPSALAGLDADSSLMGVLEGEKVKVSELLYGLMLPSGNDAANVLGEGCVDPFFKNYPAGGTAVNNEDAVGDFARYIGSYAFYNTPVTALTFPATLEYMGTQAMAGTTSLQQLTTEAADVPLLGDDVWLGVNQAVIPLYVPIMSFDAYNGAAQWQEFLVTKMAGVFGDVNCDGSVTSADITALYNYLVNGDETFIETSDVNGDGAINAADITVIYNILLGIENAPGRNKSVRDINDKINAEGFIIETGCTHTMEVELINTAGISAMQLDINMPQGLNITDVATTSRATGMAMGFNEIEPGKWRILIHNATAMKGNSGTLFNITVKSDDSFGDNDYINIDNIIAVEPTELVHLINDLTLEVGNTTGVKDISIDSNPAGPVDVYNMNGQLLRHNVERNDATQGLPAGIYIVGGKKVIVR